MMLVLFFFFFKQKTAYEMRISDWQTCALPISSLAIGLYLGFVGIDLLTGQERFTLGIPRLRDGIDVVIVAVGLFAVGEAVYMAARPYDEQEDGIIPVKGRIWMSSEDWRRSWKPWLRGRLIGFPMGTLPAGGSGSEEHTS